MAKPSKLPEWNSGGSNRVEPSSGTKGTGYATGDRPTSGVLNWLLYFIYSWIVWLDGVTGGTIADAITWAALHTFQKGILVTTSTSNGKGVDATGNGSGAGVKGTGGSSGPGVQGVGSGGPGGTFSSTGDFSLVAARGTQTQADASYNALYLIAGATHRAAIAFTPQSSVVSPSDGELWYDGTNLKLRVGSTTYTINKS